MLIMPFILDSQYLFSASKALDTSCSDTGMWSVFHRVLLPIVLFIGGELSPSPQLQISSWLLLYYKRFTLDLGFNYPAAG